MTDSSPALILTIEDEPTIRDSFRSYLEDLEYRVLEASDGASGLSLLHQYQPDLVLLDLRMPGMDGIDVLTRIRERSPDIPVIIISGAGLIEDVVNALRCGAQDFLLKPVEDLSILKHAVEKCLERVRLIRENRQYQLGLEDKVRERTRDLAEVNRRLRKSEEKYRLLFASMRHGFALCRCREHADSTRIDDFRIMEANPAFVAMIGEEGARLVDRTLAELFPGIDFRRLETGADASGGYHFEFHDRNRERLFDVLVYQRTNGDLVLILADITERQRLKSQLQQAQKMEAIGTLAGGIAHDFNNILGAQMGYGELALLDLEPHHPARHKVEQMISSCHRSKDLVARILSFCRQTHHERCPVRVDLVVEEVLQLLRAALPTTIDICKSICCPEATVSADATQIHQIVMNLCSNAHHAMLENGGQLTIAVECIDSTQVPSENVPALQPVDYVRLSVGDTGPGMPADVLRRIFDPYFTTKSKGEGTGLGLAVVRGLVESWHGTIHVDSVLGQGTVFYVYIPRIDGVGQPEVIPAKAATTGTGRILLVDDEATLVQVGHNMLAHAGYTVTTCTCPEKALAQFQASPDDFDLILTDMTMPKLTGDKLARAIHRIRPDMPIILCSGYMPVPTVGEAKTPVFAATLKKPLMMDELLEAVDRTLKHAIPKRNGRSLMSQGACD